VDCLSECFLKGFGLEADEVGGGRLVWVWRVFGGWWMGIGGGRDGEEMERVVRFFRPCMDFVNINKARKLFSSSYPAHLRTEMISSMTLSSPLMPLHYSDKAHSHSPQTPPSQPSYSQTSPTTPGSRPYRWSRSLSPRQTAAALPPRQYSCS